MVYEAPIKLYTFPDGRRFHHEDGMTAGRDLSEFISSAPHGRDILKQFEIVGKLVD